MADQPIRGEIELADLPVDLASRVERHFSPCRLDAFGNHRNGTEVHAELTVVRRTGTVRLFHLDASSHPPEMCRLFDELVHEIERYDA